MGDSSPGTGFTQAAQVEFHALILSQVSDAVIAIDHDGLVTYLNASAEQQYEVSADVVRGRPLSDVYTYRWVQPGDERQAGEALASHGVWRGENLHVLPTGRQLHVESTVTLLKDASGAQLGLLAVIRDITRAKQAEAALRESAERQRMALDAAELGTWRHDVATGHVTLDARAQLHYGISRAETDLAEVLTRVHPDDVPGLQHAMMASLDPVRREPVRAEYRVLPPDGTSRWLSINGRVQFRDIEGAAAPAVGIGTTRDITDQKRLEQTLREADRQKDEFLAILAHELRNPLAPIRTAVGILGTAGLPQPLLERSRQIIERQVGQMTRLIGDLLDVSRLSRGKVTLQTEPLVLDQVLDGAIETARPTIDERRHRLEQRRPESPICLEGDLARLSQVFGNLLNNAAKYTPAGGTVSIQVDARPGFAAVRVSDTGEGIAPDRLERIFDLFTQGSAPSATPAGGLGIGLTVARRLVELHHGTLTASSAGPGHGSTFTVTLPTLAGSPAPCERDDTAPSPARRLNASVLVVDDSADAADTTAMLLESAGATVRTVYSGEDAVSELDTFRPDIVLLDLGMPGLGGLGACRQIRARPHGRTALVVALTGWGQEEDRRKTRQAGFDDHLVKPVAPETLLNLVEARGKTKSTISTEGSSLLPR